MDAEEATFETGARIGVTQKGGPSDRPYAGRFGHFVELTNCGYGGYARVHLDGDSEAETVLLHPESIEPVCVHDIEVQQHASTGKWYATCRGDDGSEHKQWGATDIEAAENLRRFVSETMGPFWPPVVSMYED